MPCTFVFDLCPGNKHLFSNPCVATQLLSVPPGGQHPVQTTEGFFLNLKGKFT